MSLHSFNALFFISWRFQFAFCRNYITKSCETTLNYFPLTGGCLFVLWFFCLFYFVFLDIFCQTYGGKWFLNNQVFSSHQLSVWWNVEHYFWVQGYGITWLSYIPSSSTRSLAVYHLVIPITNLDWGVWQTRSSAVLSFLILYICGRFIGIDVKYPGDWVVWAVQPQLQFSYSRVKLGDIDF